MTVVSIRNCVILILLCPPCLCLRMLSIGSRSVSDSMLTSYLTAQQRQQSTLAKQQQYRRVINSALRSSKLDLNAKVLRQGVFCYAFARSPPEPTAKLVANRLEKGCDGFAVFSWEEMKLDSTHATIKAYTLEENVRAWQRQGHERMVGAWAKMADDGILGKYDWYVKFDSDSFVVPSAVAKAFARYTILQESPSIVSVEDGVEGYFDAIPYTVIEKLWRMRNNKEYWVCDELASGDNRDDNISQLDYDTMDACRDLVGPFRIIPPYDEHHNSLLAVNEEGNEANVVDNGCDNIAQKLLMHFEQHSSNAKPMCECTQRWVEEPSVCYDRESLMVIHPVKDEHTYQALMKAFL